MKKSKKSIYKKIGKILLILLLLYILGTIIFISVFPRIYLSNKYDTKFNDYKVVDYQPGYLAYDINYWKVIWHDSQLVYEFKKDGRNFKVKFMNFNYYDAYQMKEVSEWITKELQYNVDKNIDVVNISADVVYGIYNAEKDQYKNVIWTKDNVNEIIQSGRIGDIFIKSNDIEQYLENPNVSNTTNYYNSNNTNKKFNEYINDLKKRYYDLYHANNTAIYLHNNDLTIHFGYDFYGIDLNKVSYAEKSCMIVEKYYDWLTWIVIK